MNKELKEALDILNSRIGNVLEENKAFRGELEKRVDAFENELFYF